MKIDARVIPHKQQRYETVGDWWWEGEVLHIRVSKMYSTYMEMLIMHHEITEAMLCMAHGVDEKAVTSFDKNFEADRKENGYGQREPGDDMAAPYYREHQIATSFERLLAMEFGIPWLHYEETINELGELKNVETPRTE